MVRDGSARSFVPVIEVMLTQCRCGPRDCRAPPSLVLPAHVARVSQIAQIRREFAAPAAHLARTRRAGRLSQSPSAAVGGAVTSVPATTAQVRQTQAEFGFEK